MAYIIGQSREDPKTLAGTLACISSLVFCGSPLASVSDVIKTKSTEKLPFLLILSSFLVTIMWFLYGFALNDAFIQVPNAIGALISGVQLYLFVIYPNEPKSRKDVSLINSYIISIDLNFNLFHIYFAVKFVKSC